MDHLNGNRERPSYYRDSSQYAPSYDIPLQTLVSIEHPFIINDVRKAIDSLGGFSNLQEVGDDIYIRY